MAAESSFFHGFLSLFLLLCLHLGCCFFRQSPGPDTDDPAHHPSPPKRRKITPFSSSPPASEPSPNPHEPFSSIRAYLRHLFFFRKANKDQPQPQPHNFPHSTPILAPFSPLQYPIPLSPKLAADDSASGSEDKPEISAVPAAAKPSSFASRRDIFPCAACGEVLTKPYLLDLHRSTHHSLSELSPADSGHNIVRLIFHSGWRGRAAPAVHRIFKIHNTPRTLSRFEEQRETIRSRASDERCIADGNERLRFHCSTILCSLGKDGRSATCGSPYCGTCGIVRQGFAGKGAELDGISTHATGWGAHLSLPEDLESEFAFLHVRRAVLVCRVLAGRVAIAGDGEAAEEKGSPAFDSVVPVSHPGCGARRQSFAAGEGELLVFNPRAVLPCFVIIYTA